MRPEIIRYRDDFVFRDQCGDLYELRMSGIPLNPFELILRAKWSLTDDGPMNLAPPLASDTRIGSWE